MSHDISHYFTLWEGGGLNSGPSGLKVNVLTMRAIHHFLETIIMCSSVQEEGTRWM